MALIVIPDFAESTRPRAEDLNAAAAAFVGAIGGAVPGGPPVPGGLDLSNLTGGGFVNEQKAEPYAQIAVGASRNDGLNESDPKPFGPFPHDVVMTGIRLFQYAAHEGSVLVRLADQDLIELPISTAEQQWWAVAALVPAGLLLTASVTFDPVSPDPYHLVVYFKALHQR